MATNAAVISDAGIGVGHQQRVLRTCLWVVAGAAAQAADRWPVVFGEEDR